MSSLLRSTKFMRYFTGAARTLILNSAKTAESNPLINSKTLLAANNVLTRDYASTSKKTESLEPLLQKLDAEVRRFGRIAKRDIDEVFDEIRENNDITSSQSLLIIRCCGELVPEELPEQRTLLVQKIWGVLTERGVPMDISHYNALLRVYLENEHPFSPAQFLEELERKGLQPNRVTYQRLMWRYCQEGDVDGATKVLEKMRELNFPVSEPVLNALVMGHAFHGDTEGAKAVLETMAGAGLQPSNRTYSLLACGYAKQGDVEEVNKIIKSTNEKESFLTDKDILDIIEQMAIGGHGDKVEQLFPHLHKGVGYNQDVCILILRLINKGHEDVAKKVMSTMPKTTNTEDTPFKGAFFVKQLIKLNKPVDHVIKTCRELQNEHLVPSALYIATEAALQHGKSELAQHLFKELEKDGNEIRQHYYWPLLAQKGREGDEEGLLQIIRNMVSQGHTPTGEALRDYVIPHLMKKDAEENIITKLQLANVPAIHSARNLIIELLERGNISKAASIAIIYRPRGQFALMARPILNALNKTKDVDSFVSILHVISSQSQTAQGEEDSPSEESQSVTTDGNEVGRLVKTAIKALGTPLYAEKILKSIHAKGLRISSQHAEEIQQYLGQNMTASLSELLVALTSPDLEIVPLENVKRPPMLRTSAQLEKVYAQLKSSGGNLNRVQKQLLQAYIKENNTEKVESFVKELRSSKFEITLASLAQLFEYYSINDNIEKAKEMREEIQAKDPSFALTKTKLIQYAFALVRNNRFDEAIQFLNECNVEEDDESNTFMYKSKCWQVLNHLAELKEDAKVKQMTEALFENNFTAPSNVILGPSIKVHLLKDDIEGALKEFESCCSKYRTTPWKGELMKALIMKEDATKLQWLADLSTQIHGEVNILHDLVLAFVECGRLRQARRILETPGMHTRQRRLEDACQRYVEEGKSEYLEGLLEATKELSHIDRSNIFYHLLVTYCKANETDKALGLWTILQEEGEVPSEQFLQYLGQHLKSKNRPVPFILPQSKSPKTGTQKPAPKQGNVAKEKEIEQQELPTKKQISDNIEALIHSGDLTKAMDETLNSIEKGIVPKANVVKFLLRNLAEKGDVDNIMRLEGIVTDNMKRNITYDDKLTLALFNKGDSVSHMDSLLKDIQAANTREEVEKVLVRFPRSNALASLMNNDELVKKCNNLAEIAASKGFLMPANLLWMEYLLSGRDNAADNIYKLWLKDADALVFRRLLQESHVRKQPQLIEKLITALKSNEKITLGSLGNAFSRLINVYLVDNNTNDALAAFERAVKMGITSTHFNKSSLNRLKTAVEAEGKTFDYTF